MRHGSFCMVAVLGFGGCAPDASDTRLHPATDVLAAREAPGTNVADLAKNYTRFELMTPEPVLVDAGLAADCRGSTEVGREVHGPHALAVVKIYMSDGAASAFRIAATTYPVGSVIVKEKRRADWLAGPP